MRDETDKSPPFAEFDYRAADIPLQPLANVGEEVVEPLTWPPSLQVFIAERVVDYVLSR